jgi:hypothetical protein
MQFNLTSNFAFDGIAVMRSADDAKERAGKKIGAFVRRTARQLTNKSGRKGASKPGEPPKRHRGDLRDRIVFAFDDATRKVVIGPTLFNAVYFDGDGKPVSGTVPSVLEYGGAINVAEEQYPSGWLKTMRERGETPQEWRRIDHRKRRTTWPKRIRQINIAPRPYMLPALMENVDNKSLEKAWENILK